MADREGAWSTSATASRTRGGGRRKHWKLPDMIQGVRHRFRDKRRSKSPEYTLNSGACYNNGGPSLTRASSMMSTDYGFNAEEWGPGGGHVTSGSRGQPCQPPVNSNAAANLITSSSSNLATFRNRKNNSDTGYSSGGTRQINDCSSSGVINNNMRVPPISVTGDNGVMSDCDFISSSALSSRLTSSSSGSGSANKTGGVGRAASVSAVNQSGLTHGNSIQRAKSVRFGENRISVFLQDSTQALEECVRLALSYAEESKRGDYCSDSEAVTLSRSLNQSHAAMNQPCDNSRNKAGWSDSENTGGTKSQLKDFSSRDFSNFSEGPQTPTNYKPRTFGQAVNSLDRVERLDQSQIDKSRKKRSAQINEIFSFIDKILSGCDSGCNDEYCPFVRDSRTDRFSNHPSSRSYRYNSSATSAAEYHQSQKSPSFPGVSGADSYAYSEKLVHEDLLHQSEYSSRNNSKLSGRNPRSATPLAGAGFVSDSDCDTSECSTLVDRTGHRRPPRSRLRPDRRQGPVSLSKRTTEDVFAQIIICCESNKESFGMPKYSHIHQKISQTVCNAIFLCKVIYKLISSDKSGSTYLSENI